MLLLEIFLIALFFIIIFIYFLWRDEQKIHNNKPPLPNK